MTSLLDSAPVATTGFAEPSAPASHPRDVVRSLHQALDTAGPIEGVTASECDALIAEVTRARTRLQAYELRLVAAAAKTSVASDAGQRTTGDWLAGRTRTTAAAAARTVGLATDLDTRLPATSDALDAGLVSPDHASVIARATSQLREGLSLAQLAAVEQRLVERSRTLDPTQLRRHARRVLADIELDQVDQAVVDAHEDTLLVDEETRALAKARLTLHDNDDGTVTGHFIVPHLAGSVLRKIIAAMTAPRRAALGATRAQGAQPIDRDWAHERGVAFADLLTHLPTDRLSGKAATTIVVTMDHRTLAGAAKAAGIDTSDRLSAAATRRLACTSGLVPVVLGGDSQPLDLGRQRRLFSEAQRVAGAISHTTCAADGCQTP